MTEKINIEMSKERGICNSCGDEDWLFPDKNRKVCGMCKQEKEFIEMTIQEGK